MKKLFLIVLLSTLALPAFAGRLQLHVGEIAVEGASDRSLQKALPRMLASRLTSGEVVAVDDATAADIAVSGSYTVLGRNFSLDLVARDRQGKVVSRVFEQGAGDDDIMTAVGNAAGKLSATLRAVSAPPPPPPVAAPRVEQPEIVRAAPVESQKDRGGSLGRLEGVFNGIALGRDLGAGAREIFLSSPNALLLCRLEGEGITRVAEVTYPAASKVLGVESADLDDDGVPEAYVTVFRSDRLSSEVYRPREKGLEKIASGLPYFFRSIEVEGKKRMFVQEMGVGDDFFGKVHFLLREGSAFRTGESLALPSGAGLHSFSWFRDAKGERYLVYLHRDGYPVVCTDKGEELWRGGDKLGGSETYFQRQDYSNALSTGETVRWRFLEQRIAVTPQGEILIPRNHGTFVLGNSRTYGKNSIYGYAWNGAALEERWHTRENQNYLADFAYDSSRGELLSLEVVKRDSLLGRGASGIFVRQLR